MICKILTDTLILFQLANEGLKTMDYLKQAMDYIEKLLQTPELTAFNVDDETLDLLIEVAKFQNTVIHGPDRTDITQMSEAHT